MRHCVSMPQSVKQFVNTRGKHFKHGKAKREETTKRRNPF